MAKTAQKRKAKNSKMPASICWFEVPADDLGRAKKFYSSLFGWKFAKLPAAVQDYWHIDTGGKDASPDGGVFPRMHPKQTITVYISVPSVDKAMAKVKKLGGTVCAGETAVPGMGFFAIGVCTLFP
jgi:predicted enzyme related to lactoylglutathione lyase